MSTKYVYRTYAWYYYTLRILVARKLRGDESKASLVYKVSSRTARATQRNPVWKNKTNKKTRDELNVPVDPLFLSKHNYKD